MAEGGALLRSYGAERLHRGFESLLLRSEGCRSGRTGRSRKPLGVQAPRGFKSLPLRFLAEPERAPRKVLVVDDEAPIRLLCRVNFEAHGFEVVEAKDGVEALELAEREQPDLILLGVMMPRLVGWEVLPLLEENPKTRDIPVVFLTARARAVDRLRGLELGALDYLTKPFNPPEVVVYVDRLLDRLDRGEREQILRESLAKVRAVLETSADSDA